MSWDGIHSDISETIRLYKEADWRRENAARIGRLNSDINDLNRIGAQRLVCLTIAERELRKIDPDHPYFASKDEAVTLGNLEFERWTDYEKLGQNFPEFKGYKTPAELAFWEAQKEVVQLRRELEQLKSERVDPKRIEILERDCVHHMALHYAYRKELAQLLPKHELISDPAVINDLITNAYNLFKETRSWDEVRKFGQSYQSTVREQIELEYAMIFGEEQDRSLATAGEAEATHVPVEGAFEKQLTEVIPAKVVALERDCVHHLAVSSALREALRSVCPSHRLVQDSAARREVAESAYELFKSTKSWSAVKEYAKTFADRRQADVESEYESIFDQAMNFDSFAESIPQDTHSDESAGASREDSDSRQNLTNQN